MTGSLKPTPGCVHIPVRFGLDNQNYIEAKLRRETSKSRIDTLRLGKGDAYGEGTEGRESSDGPMVHPASHKEEGG